jgi:hypothetical protein
MGGGGGEFHRLESISSRLAMAFFLCTFSDDGNFGPAC